MAESSSSGNGSPPTLPPGIDVASLVQQAQKEASSFNPASWVDDLIRKWILGHLTGVIAVCSQGASMLDDLLAPIVKLIGAFQGTNEPGFFTLLAAILSDVMGVDFDIPTVKGAWGKAGSMTGFTKIGQDYYQALLKQLGNPKTLTPEGGLAAAEGFLGYVLGFGVREGNLGLLMSWLPEEWRIFDKLEEYPKAIRANLGFGRISRQILHPLVQTLVTDPLQWYVNRQYTPKLLGEALAVRAYNRGKITPDVFATEMAYAGYSPTRWAVMTEDALTHLSVNDAWELYKSGQYDDQALYAALKENGWAPGEYEDWIAARTAAEVDPWTAALITDWKTQRAGGFINQATFDAYIQGLKVPQAVKDAIKQSVGQLYDLPWRKLTLAEVQSAFVEGLVDSDYVTNYLKHAGYSSDDQVTLYYQTLMKLGTAEAKKAVAQFTYDKAVAKAQAAGQPVPPPPAILAETPGIPGL